MTTRTTKKDNQPVPHLAASAAGEPAHAVSVPHEANPFDPAKLRLSQDFGAELGVKKQLLAVPVKRPSRQDWVRVHPDESYRLPTAVLEVKEERETYLVAPELLPALAGDVIPKVLFTAITRQGVVFLWHVRLPGEDGRIDGWNRVAMEAAHMGMDQWVRLAANHYAGTYDVFTTVAELPEPEWPEISFQKVLELAFRDKYIETPDHPVLRRLRGEI